MKTPPKSFLRIGDTLFPVAHIIMLEASANYTYFYLNSGKRLISTKTIKHFEALCKDFDFIRTHRSYIINGLYLRKYREKDKCIELHYNLEALISRRRKENVEYYLFLKNEYYKK